MDGTVDAKEREKRERELAERLRPEGTKRRERARARRRNIATVLHPNPPAGTHASGAAHRTSVMNADALRTRRSMEGNSTGWPVPPHAHQSTQSLLMTIFTV